MWDRIAEWLNTHPLTWGGILAFLLALMRMRGRHATWISTLFEALTCSLLSIGLRRPHLPPSLHHSPVLCRHRKPHRLPRHGLSQALHHQFYQHTLRHQPEGQQGGQQ